MISVLSAIVSPPLNFLHDHLVWVVWVAAGALSVVGWRLTGPHGRRS